ncbi:PilZ domain-containing protein, partial [Escherichia coli]|nr:PilZ domain-containing protein [Escherichia coli]
LTNGTRNPCSVIDFSEGGLGITLHGGVDNRNIEKNKPMTLYLHTGDEECAIPVEIVHAFKNKIGLKILPMTHKQHIDYVRAT